MKDLVIIVIVILGIEIISTLLSNKKVYKTVNNQYKKKKIMSQNEINFYNKLKNIESKMNVKVFPQINLASVIEKINKTRYQTELFRNIDYGIFNEEYELILLIELNDQTHNQKNRIKRDKSVKEICQKANIKIITFYTKYPNELEYIENRIKKEISNN